MDPFLLAAAAVMVFILDWAGVALYLSLVRRLKAHMFWRGALVWKLGRLLRKTAVSLYEHSSIVSRELIPFFVIVLFNLCMGFLGGLWEFWRRESWMWRQAACSIWKERICRAS